VRAELAARQEPEDYGSEPVINERGEYQVGQESALGQLSDAVLGVAGQREALLANLSGMVAAPVSQIGGGIQAVLNPNNPVAGPEARDRIADTLTLAPETAKGKQIIQGQAELLAPVSEAIEKTRLGDEALEAGYPEWVARTVEAVPEYAGVLLAALGLRAPKAPKKPKIKVTEGGRIEPILSEKASLRSSLINQKPDPKTAQYKLGPNKALIPDKVAKAAAAQGWSDDVIQTAKTASKSAVDRNKALEMLRIARKAKRDSTWGASNRPTDVVGSSVMERYNALKKINGRAGSQVDKVARSTLRGNVDASGIFGKFRSTIDDLGGTVNDKGQLEFGVNSKLYGQAKNQKNLQPVLNRINALGDNPTAYSLHNTKQWLYKFVEYKNKGGKGGLTGDSEAAIKALARDINERLKGISKPYDKVNTAYSDTADAINALGDSLGKTLYGANAEKATGTTMRRWIGNATSRVPISNAVQGADDVLAKYGIKFKDNPANQVLFANALDDLLTTPTNRTTFKAEGGKVVERALTKSALQHGADLLDEGVNRMRGVSDEAALNALEDIIRDYATATTR
jgi:hypothetical protein